MFNTIKNIFSKSYQDLDGKIFKQKFQSSNSAVLLDVRTPGEYQSGTIKGAKNIDIQSPDFEKRIAALDTSKEYFVFCRSGARSGRACEFMASKGFKAFNLVGGIAAWN